MKEFSPQAKEELRTLWKSTSLREDMAAVRANRHNPFVKNGHVDVDAYIEFVTQYNAFINHAPKPFKPMTGDHFRL